VAFVSLTNMPKNSVAAFVERMSIPWPSGYGASNETIARFGAYGFDRALPGYEVTPTLYLIGPDGLIRWNDRQARSRHEDKGPLLKELETEIERALKAPSSGGESLP
jgi:hypothetical protein